MKNLSQFSTSWRTTAIIVCFAGVASAQWTGNATIYPTNSNASVGIGINTPQARLHVKGSAINLKLESTTSMNLLGFQSSGAVKLARCSATSEPFGTQHDWRSGYGLDSQ